MPTTGTSKSIACRATNSGWDPPAAIPMTRKRSGCCPMTSSAWVPTDPVDPRTTTSRRSMSPLFPTPDRTEAGRFTPAEPPGLIPPSSMGLGRLQLGAQQPDEACDERHDDPDRGRHQDLRPFGGRQRVVVVQRLLSRPQVKPGRRVLESADETEQDR